MRLVILSVLLVGCGAAQKPAELRDDVREYGDGLRWQNLPAAVGHIPPDERADFMAEREELQDDLRIGDWEVERVDWVVKDRRAKVRVTWTWHLDSQGLVHKTVTEQRWERRGKRWWLIDEVHERGEPMPGVAVKRAAGRAAPHATTTAVRE